MKPTRTRQIMVALGQAALPKPDELLQAHATLFPDVGKLTLDAAQSSADTLSLRTPTCTFAIGLLPTPLPWSELAGPIAAAWYWPEAAETLRPARAHAVVSARSELADPIELMFAITRVVAALAASSSALGIYLGGAGQVHKVEDFVSEATTATREQLPLYLWVRFGLAEQEDGTLSLFTSGLAQFELMEIEFPHSPLEPQSLMDRAFNIAHYLLEQGPVLESGQTIGTSANEKFKVTHAASARPGHDTVYKLELSGSERKGSLPLLN
ncbi:MAG: hypothetical protein JWN48_2252 [Myxococcaceae bacterium]|nr:hypothetical protein [Myxococcaceae bacterium]